MQRAETTTKTGYITAILSGLAVVTLSSCTTTSNLSGLSQENIQAVNRIAEEGVKETAAVGNSDSIVGVPEKPAEEKPAVVMEAKPPVSLTSVPRTSVMRRPTNEIMMVRTTAYSHLQADSLPYGKLSAAGNTLKYGSQVRSAAADWSKYPLGTRFKIEGLPYEYVVDDYGSALVGGETIDIYKPDLSGIGRWGVRNIPITVVEWGCFDESRKILDDRKHVKHAGHVRKMLSEIDRRAAAGEIELKSDDRA